MKILVCLISSQTNITDTVRRQRERLIPQDLFKNKKGPDYPVHFKVSVFDPTVENIAFDSFLLRLVRGMDAVILLVEKQYRGLTEVVSNAVFASTFESSDEKINNFKNFFGSHFSQIFRNFFVIKRLMSEADREQAMTLPLRNFEAPELREIARISREESKSANFVFNIEAQLALLFRRKLPRKKSSGKTKYFIDGKQMHFVYGHEQHARFDTREPHTAACEINGLFRFGKSIDPTRHFNASCGDGDKTSVSGTFPDCHGALITVPKGAEKTHLNMFANDFF